MTKKRKEYRVTKGPAGPPVHPGKILREDVLPELRLAVSQAATELGVSRQTLYKILAEEAPITPEMAVRLGRFCGNGPGLWIRLQGEYDVWHAAEKLGAALEEIPEHRAV